MKHLKTTLIEWTILSVFLSINILNFLHFKHMKSVFITYCVGILNIYPIICVFCSVNIFELNVILFHKFLNKHTYFFLWFSSLK